MPTKVSNVWTVTSDLMIVGVWCKCSSLAAPGPLTAIFKNINYTMYIFLLFWKRFMLSQPVVVFFPLCLCLRKTVFCGDMLYT